MTLIAASPIIVSKVNVLAAAKRYILSRVPRTPYTDEEVTSILYMYGEVCRVAEVDVELAVTQLVHETGALTSEWSLPPNRNPAGIGVTGVPGAGEKFGTWLDSVECHVGLLLAYALPAGSGTIEQQRLVNDLLSRRPSAPRAVGNTVGQMAVKWAADPAYVDRLNTVSQAILKS